jgi:peptide/nickel transport system ATP-binding protein
MAERLLEVRGLKTHFATDDGMVHAVDGVSLHVDAGETLGVVGESGCGKSVTAFTIMRLIPIPPGRIVAGEILWRGRDLLGLSVEEMRGIRAKEIAMVFQEPMTSLNPVYTVGEQIAEVIRLHEGLGRRAALGRAADMLQLVHISNPERRIHDYPHQFSGGMRQRVMIAMALSCNPKLLIADEPTTALDVTIQAQILELLNDLKDRLGWR